jgi:hypothetical protein
MAVPAGWLSDSTSGRRPLPGAPHRPGRDGRGGSGLRVRRIGIPKRALRPLGQDVGPAGWGTNTFKVITRLDGWLSSLTKLATLDCLDGGCGRLLESRSGSASHFA